MTTRPVDLCVLLAGGLKPSPLAAAAGCSVLDLTPNGSKTIMEHWIEHLAPLGSEDAPLQVRIMHGSRLAPTAPPDHATPPCLQLSIERETKEFRGPAGVVKDAANDLPIAALTQDPAWQVVALKKNVLLLLRGRRRPCHSPR